MKKQSVALLALMAVAGTTMAAPRESRVAPTPLNVWGASGTPDSFTLSFAGTDAGGSYSAYRVHLAGQLVSNQTYTWPADCVVDITPPGGAAVTVLLSLVQGGYTTINLNANKSLGGATAVAGTWSFTLRDTFEDGDGTAPESVLNNLVVTLDDAPPAPPAATNLGTLVDGSDITTSFSLDPTSVKWFKFTCPDVLATNGRALDITTNGSIGADTMIAVYSDTGAGLIADDDSGSGTLSLLSFGTGWGLSVPDGSTGQAGDLNAGTYYIVVGESLTEFGLTDWEVEPVDGFGGDYQLEVHMGVPPPATAPTAIDLGTLVDGTPVVNTVSLAAGEVKWYKATVAAATGSNGRTFSISTIGSAGGDSEIGLYSSTGAMIGNNDDSTGLLSYLAYGADGTADLAAGLYYIPVGSFNTTFNNANWFVTSTGPAADFQLTVSQVLASSVITYDEAIDGGGDSGQDLATAQTISGSGPIDRINGTFAAGVADIDMFLVNICDTASFSIDTNGPGIDTQLFLFDSAGAPIVMNDDNGAGGLWSKLDSTSGLVTTAGNYYLAVARYDNDPTDSGGNEIWADTPFGTQRGPDGPGAAGPLGGWNGTNTTGASYRINLTGVCKVGATGCGPADIGSVGGVAGADGHLDNNDFIVYINNFFNAAPSADIGTTGGVPGHDGAFDNNDFIVFIDQFFNAPASCR